MFNVFFGFFFSTYLLKVARFHVHRYNKILSSKEISEYPLVDEATALKVLHYIKNQININKA